MDFTKRARNRRALLSIAAAVLGIGICIYQGHVHIAVSHPRTYSSAWHHRCGRLMLASLSWASFEMVGVITDKSNSSLREQV